MDNDYLTTAFINKQMVKRGGGRGAWITIISPLCSLTNKWSGGIIAVDACDQQALVRLSNRSRSAMHRATWNMPQPSCPNLENDWA